MAASDTANISYQPTAGLSYDPNESVYWDKAALDGELLRVFEVCHGCRMCFKYCDAFPNLFSLIDDEYDGDVTRLTPKDKDAVVDACFQCKLCEVQCPYTPRDQHEFQLDFPKLMHRYQAQRTRDRGVGLRDSVLGDPDGTARAARLSFGLANVMNRVGIHRWFMEKLLGIHRKKLLPDFAARTFSRWAEDKGLMEKGPGGEAVLFQTCYVEHNEPQIGRDTVEVMERNGVDVRCEKGLECCGMPAWEHGDLSALRRQAKNNLDRLEPHVDAGAKVLAINPTCAMMLRREYPELVDERDQARAQKVAAAVADPGEFLWKIRKEERFNTDFKSSPGAQVAYHAPCHLRAQAVGFKGRDLLKKLPDVEKVATVMECCGHDGTYAMRTDGFEPSQRIGKKSFEGMKKPEARIWATECPLAALQFQQHAGKKPMHPMSILARSYRGESFEAEVKKGALPILNANAE
jgi:Fe-S oxidoreductase